MYSYNFPDDRKRVKLLGMQSSPHAIFSPSDGSHVVYGIFFLETVQTVLRGADLFYWFASGYGDMKHLLNPFTTPFDGPILESLVSTIVRFFYAYRIWVITNKRSWWLCFLICLVRQSLASLKHLFLVLLFRSFPSSTWQPELLVVFM